MKKSNILIAMFAVIIAVASTVKAEDVVSFDGNKGGGSVSFADLLKPADSCQNDNIKCEQPKPVPVMAENSGRPSIFKAKGEIISSQRVFSPTEIMAMDAAIESAITYANTHQASVISPRILQLLKNGTPAQKFEFINTERGSRYQFPGDAASSRYCTSWGTKQTCVNETTYHDVCKTMAGACVVTGWVAGVAVTSCAPAYLVCEAVATIAPRCFDVPYCIIDSNNGVVDPSQQS